MIQQEEPPSLDHRQLRRLLRTPLRIRMWLVIVGCATLVVGGLAIASNVVQVFGAPWPTEPTFTPGANLSASPFDVPFSVTNRSALFSINNLSLSCRLISGRTVRLRIKFDDVEVRVAVGVNVLRPLESRPYVCPFNRTISVPDKFEAAQIEFKSKYKSPWPFRPEESATSEIFTWYPSPPHWEVGVPLQ
jgi:hypothetical protein